MLAFRFICGKLLLAERSAIRIYVHFFRSFRSSFGHFGNKNSRLLNGHFALPLLSHFPSLRVSFLCVQRAAAARFYSTQITWLIPMLQFCVRLHFEQRQ